MNHHIKWGGNVIIIFSFVVFLLVPVLFACATILCGGYHIMW